MRWLGYVTAVYSCTAQLARATGIIPARTSRQRCVNIHTTAVRLDGFVCRSFWRRTYSRLHNRGRPSIHIVAKHAPNKLKLW